MRTTSFVSDEGWSSLPAQTRSRPSGSRHLRRTIHYRSRRLRRNRLTRTPVFAGRRLRAAIEHTDEWMFCPAALGRKVSDVPLGLEAHAVGKTTRLKFGELFCGPGGIGWAAKTVRVETEDGRVFELEHAWATDYDRDSCKTYARNILPDKQHAVVCEDIRELDLERLAAIEKDIDVLAFGFPCNDFSIVGERKGINGKYGPLYKYSVAAVRRFRPKWFFAENVGGLRNSNEGEAFRLILKEFADLGYRLYPHLYKFEEYGVPQKRHRIVIIGIDRNEPVSFEVPAPIYTDESQFVSVEEALKDIPEWASNQEPTRHAPHVLERLKYIREGENAFTAAHRMPEHLRLKVNGAKLSHIYRRLDRKKPSYTITGSGGGGTHVYHWEENRALTNRERARIQTFRDDFVFFGNKESVRKQIGMAVPPQGALVILEAVLKSYAGIPYPSVPPNLMHYLEELPTREQAKLLLEPVAAH